MFRNEDCAAAGMIRRSEAYLAGPACSLCALPVAPHFPTRDESIEKHAIPPSPAKQRGKVPGVAAKMEEEEEEEEEVDDMAELRARLDAIRS